MLKATYDALPLISSVSASSEMSQVHAYNYDMTYLSTCRGNILCAEHPVYININRRRSQSYKSRTAELA